MKRPIRFRVWNKKLGRFLSKEEYCLDFDGGLIFVNVLQGNLVKLEAVNPEIFIVQQFTGLKDKNGKEIYEEDVIKIYLENQSINVKVYWDEELFMYKTTAKMAGLYENLLELVGENIEVIGNVLENPLLYNPPKKDLDKEDENKEDETINLKACPNCDERAWDGYICHSCGAKYI